MKRELLQNVKVQPYTSENVIEKKGFLSGILGVEVGTPTGAPTGLAVKLTLTESDTPAGTFAAVADKSVILDKTLDPDGSVTVDVAAVGGELVNFDMDLVGCKNYIKIKVEIVCTGGTNPACTTANALVLGDCAEQPA